MLNEWLDRQPDPPSSWRRRAMMALAVLAFVAILVVPGMLARWMTGT